MNDTKRCANCILPSTYPGIEFDEKGVCSYCHAEMHDRTLHKDKKGKADLDKIILAHKGKNPKDISRDHNFCIRAVKLPFNLIENLLKFDSSFSSGLYSVLKYKPKEI